MRTLPTFDLQKIEPPKCALNETDVFNVTCRKGPNAIEILVDDVIGDDGYGGGVQSREIKQMLSENPAAKVKVAIASQGGLVYEGLRIYNLLAAHEGEVITINESLAYSAASVIFLAGNRRLTYETANFGIHKVQGGGFGTAELLLGVVDFIDQLDSMTRELYQKISGQSAEQIESWLMGTTSGQMGSMFKGQEAVDAGFATEVIDPSQTSETINKVETPVEKVPELDPVAEALNEAGKKAILPLAIQARRAQIDTMLGRV